MCGWTSVILFLSMRDHFDFKANKKKLISCNNFLFNEFCTFQ